MNKEFKIYQDKLNIDVESDPEVSFGHIGLKNQIGEEKGEFFVFTYSYLVKNEDAREIENDESITLNMDIEMSNFIKMYTMVYLSNSEAFSTPYCFVTTRKPLVTLEEYINMLKKDSGLDALFNTPIENPLEGIEEDSYIRMCLCVGYPENVPIPEQVAIDMGIDFIENFDMEDLDIAKIQELYNESVDKKAKEKSPLVSNIYYFYLNNLGDLLKMPFRSQGKVYKNNRTDKPEYIYETDAMLFDFLDEYDMSPILLCEMDVVVEDVSKLVDVIK